MQLDRSCRAPKLKSILPGSTAQYTASAAGFEAPPSRSASQHLARVHNRQPGIMARGYKGQGNPFGPIYMLLALLAVSVGAACSGSMWGPAPFVKPARTCRVPRPQLHLAPSRCRV